MGNVSNPTPAGFPFSINGGATFYVGVGQCVSQAVGTGQNLVTEQVDPTGASILQSIKVAPQTANVVHKVKNSKSQAGYAKVDVSSGADVTVTFKNEPATGQLKVCKISGSTALNGEFFSFTEQAGGTIVGPFSVQAEPAGAPLNCGGLTSYPVGTVVNIAEAATPGVEVSSVTGASWSGGQDATATVQPRWYDRRHLHQLVGATALRLPATWRSARPPATRSWVRDRGTSPSPAMASLPRRSRCWPVSAAGTLPFLSVTTPSRSRSRRRTT